MGIVYVLTNAAMPGLVKIGMTDEKDASARIGQLYATGVPLPFDLQYACRVDDPARVEQALHVAFGPQRLNPKREFFKVDPEQAIAILRLLDKQPDADATAEIKGQASGVDDESAAAAARARRPNLNFREMGIPSGSVLQADHDPQIKVTVVGDKKVRLGEDEMFFSAATQQAFGLDYAVRPAPFWRYNGRLLSEIYEETYTQLE
jgi:hypothetical protein